MELSFKSADASDAHFLLEMMRELAAHDHRPFDGQEALSALHLLLADASFGRVYLMLAEGAVAGYIILTLGFSLEYHGRDAFIDEIFVRENYRGRGLGKRGLQFIEDVCRELKVRAIHLEVERGNTPAQSVYRRAGFAEHDSYLMTKWVVE